MSKVQQMTYWAVIVLLAASGTLFGFRVLTGRTNDEPKERKVWHVKYDVRFQTTKAGEQVTVAVPAGTARHRVHRESFVRAGVGLEVTRDPKSGDRTLTVTSRRGMAPSRFVAEFEIHPAGKPGRRPNAARVLPEDVGNYWLRPEAEIQIDDARVQKALKSVRPAGPTTNKKLLTILFTHCRTAVRREEEQQASDAAGALDTGTSTVLGQARSMVALCRAAGIPARVVAGFYLDKRQLALEDVWVEAYESGNWTIYDLRRGRLRPPSWKYLPVKKDGGEVLSAPEGASAGALFSLVPVKTERNQASARSTLFGSTLDLARLPQQARTTIRLLLFIPIGMLASVILGRLPGIQTPGIVAPVLVSAALAHSDILAGTFLCCACAILFIMLRLALAPLDLDTGPRVGMLGAAVAVGSGLALSALHQVGWEGQVESMILPLMAMLFLCERLDAGWHWDGMGRALKRLGGAAVVAAACYPLFRWEALGVMLLKAPETVLLGAAVALLIGHYSRGRIRRIGPSDKVTGALDAVAAK